MENGAKIGAAPSHGEGTSTALLAAMQERFATLPGNITNAISEAFKSVKAFSLTEIKDEDILSCRSRSVRKYGQVKADLEISYDEEIQEEYILSTMASPPRSRSGKRLMAKARSV